MGNKKRQRTAEYQLKKLEISINEHAKKAIKNKDVKKEAAKKKRDGGGNRWNLDSTPGP